MKKIILTSIFLSILILMVSCEKTDQLYNKNNSSTNNSSTETSNISNSSTNIISYTTSLSSEELQKAEDKLNQKLSQISSVYISLEDQERYKQTQMELLENARKIEKDFEAMVLYYTKNDYLHNEIGYIENNDNNDNYHIKGDLKEFKKYINIIFDNTDFNKIVFKKDCMFLVLKKYKEKYVTCTIYSKKFDYKKSDANVQKGYLNAYCVYEERID